MKIGIIGAGQLGKDLYLRLRDGEDTTCLYSRQYGFDARRLDIAKEIVKSNDVVVNCAAMTNVDLCEIHHHEAIDANVTLPQNLASLCEDRGIPFVHISTDYVYGDVKTLANDTSLKEDTPCSPNNFYGETKLIADDFIEQNNRVHLILRPSWLFGPGQNNFIFKMIKNLSEISASDLKEGVYVVNDQFGVPTSTSLIASTIKIWLDGQIENGIYNIRNEIDSDGCPSRYRIADFIKETLNFKKEIKPCTTEAFPLPAKRQKNSFLSINKLLGELSRTEIERPTKICSKKHLIIPYWKTAVNAYVINTINNLKHNDNVE